ncbi:MAG: ATP-binding cassette domain-containing protein [Bacilli bacterium]|nr:ATP-binding cassette domain-containing protein [Bacilli bacterium]
MNSNITKIIEIDKLCKYYGKNKVLDIDYFCFLSSYTYLLIGANGAGKSTLIKLIINLIKASRGSIYVYTKYISYVPERFLFPDNIKTYDFLCTLCKVRGFGATNSDVARELEWWGIDKDKNINALSKGMKQKVLIIQAIIEDSELYIFDEPLNGLDPNSQADFIQVIKNLKRLGKTIIVCTHYDKYYASVFDYLVYFNGGMISEVIKSN